MHDPREEISQKSGDQDSINLNESAGVARVAPRQVEAILKKHFGKRPTVSELLAKSESDSDFLSRVDEIATELSDALEVTGQALERQMSLTDQSAEIHSQADEVESLGADLGKGVEIESHPTSPYLAQDSSDDSEQSMEDRFASVELVMLDHLSRGHHVLEFEYGRTVSKSSSGLDALQGNPFNPRDALTSLESGSPLEAFAFLESCCLETDPASSLGYIVKIIDMLEVLDSSDLMHQRAAEWLQAKFSELRTIEELGSDVPVIVRGTLSDPDVRHFEKLPSELFGHTCAVIFYEGEGIWGVMIPRDVTSHPEIQECLRKNFLDSGNDLSNLFGEPELVTASFHAVKQLVEILRREKLLALSEVNAIVHESISADVYASGRMDIQRLFIDQQSKPVIIQAIERGAFSSCKTPLYLGDPSGRRVSLGATNGSEVRWMLKKRLAKSTDKQVFDQLAKKIAEKPVAYFQFDFYCGRKLVVLERPLGPFADSQWLHNPSVVGRREKDFQIYGFQYINSVYKWIPLVKPLEITTAASRFNQKPMRLDWFTVARLEVDTPINRQRMTKAFDPELKGLVRSVSPRGWNVETNFLDISIPLVKPSQEQLQHPRLERIRSLGVVPRYMWERLVTSIDGDFLLSVEDFIRSLERSDRGTQQDKIHESEPEPSVVGEGKFYKEPRQNLRMYGPWMLSTVRVEGALFYVVDSCAYGDALYLFRTEEGAKLAAEHFQRFGLRREARSFSGFVQRVLHTEFWRENLTEAVYRHILNQPFIRGVTPLLG